MEYGVDAESPNHRDPVSVIRKSIFFIFICISADYSV